MREIKTKRLTIEAYRKLKLRKDLEPDDPRFSKIHDFIGCLMRCPLPLIELVRVIQ